MMTAYPTTTSTSTVWHDTTSYFMVEWSVVVCGVDIYSQYGCNSFQRKENMEYVAV